MRCILGDTVNKTYKVSQRMWLPCRCVRSSRPTSGSQPGQAHLIRHGKGLTSKLPHPQAAKVSFGQAQGLGVGALPGGGWASLTWCYPRAVKSFSFELQVCYFSLAQSNGSPTQITLSKNGSLTKSTLRFPEVSIFLLPW